MEIDEVQVDDISAAVTFAVEAIDGGWWNGDLAEALLNKQADPSDLIAKLQGIGRTDAAGYNPYRGGNGQFAPGPHAARSERASAALQDPAFVAQHTHRLEAAASEAMGTPGHDVHRAVHAEVMRIHAEHDAIGGDARRAELADYARASAHRESLVAQHEHAIAALAADHAAGLEERRAAVAGHISDVPRAKHDAFLATRDQLHKQLVDTHEGLDRAHANAAEALHRLRSIDPSGNEHHPGFEHKLEGVRDLHDDFGTTSATFAEVTGGHAREFAPSAHDDARPFPQRDDFHASHEYESAIAAHENQFKQRALLAQSALERLHEQQSATAQTLKDVGKQHDKSHAASIREVERLGEHDLVNEKAFAHYERDRDGEIKDAIGAAHRERAQDASERRVSLAQSERDAARLHDLEDTRTALHEETQSTRAAIRALAKITGRKANLVKKA